MGLYTTTTSIDDYWIGNKFEGLTALASTVIDDAEREIRKRLSDRYDISSATFNTTTSIPPMVRTLSLWYALGLLYGANARGGKDAFQRSDFWTKKALDNLKEISNYEANILDTSGAVIADGSNSLSIQCNTTDYTETFQEDSELNWELDPDKLDDIEDSR